MVWKTTFKWIGINLLLEDCSSCIFSEKKKCIYAVLPAVISVFIVATEQIHEGQRHSYQYIHFTRIFWGFWPGLSSWQKNLPCFNFLSFFNFISLFNFTILYWFCHILTWIRHRYTCVPHPEPSSLLPPHTIPLIFSLSFFTFIRRLFSSSLSAIRVVSSAYLTLFIFLPAILISACASSSLAFHVFCI